MRSVGEEAALKKQKWREWEDGDGVEEIRVHSLLATLLMSPIAIRHCITRRVDYNRKGRAG